MRKTSSVLISMFLCLNSLSCSESEDYDQDNNGKEPPIEYEQSRSRIAWDYSSKVSIIPRGNYTRMIELSNGHLITVSGGGKGVEMSRSTDKGKTWSTPKVLAQSQPDLKMSVPDIMECSDGSLLLSYNPRPLNENTNTELKYGIRAKISTNQGETWGNEIFVYDAQHTYIDGCWEPFTLQLPSGEIQLFFANENDYQSSNEQDISMCRSTDGGKTWSTREIVSFRAGYRDGMPSGLYMEDTDEIIVAIEDNGYPEYPHRFRPAIVRTSKNWSDGTVSGSSERRDFALADPLPAADNAAAPYIRRLKSGEVIMSYQGTENRDVPIHDGLKTITSSQEMFVTVGDKTGRNFTHRTNPFRLPLGPNNEYPQNAKGYEGVWNSVTVLKDGSVWALTSTNAYDYPAAGIYGMKGYVLNDIKPKKQGVVLDGNGAEWYKESPQFVVAHQLPVQLYGYTATHSNTLFVLFEITNKENITKDKDAVMFTIASESGNSQIAMTIPADGKALISGESADQIICKTSYIKYDNKYYIEIGIPHSVLEANNVKESALVQVSLFDTDSEGNVYQESITNTTADKSSWLKIRN